jgi:DNA polymerase III sliding clamp (beta) subunit (PCNA family)
MTSNQRTFSVHYSDMLHFCQLASLISPKEHELDIITYTKFKISKNSLFLEASQMTYALQKEIACHNSDVEEELGFLIKTDVLFDCISSFSCDVLDLSLNIETAEISLKANSAKAKLRINLESTNDWKEFDWSNTTPSLAKVSLLGADFARANQLSQIAVGQPKIVLQPEFLNICYTLRPDERQLVVVSSDKYRLILNALSANYEEIQSENAVTESTNFLIPSKVASLINRVCKSSQEIELIFNQSEVRLTAGNIKLFSQYIDGDYPDYLRIVPQSFSCSFQINKNDLQEAIKQVFFLSRNQFNKDITFTFQPNQKKVLVTSKSDMLGESQNELDLNEYEGEMSDWSQSFNATYFLDYLTSSKDDILVWDANPGKPSVLSGKDKKSESLYLVCGLNR